MSRAAIVAPVRTAVGRFGGTLRPVPAEDLAATVIRAVVARSGIDPERIEDVVMAQSYANSEAPCIGRWAALQAGLPIAVPGLQIDRRCGGGLQAVATAAMMVQTGAADAVLAGGTESMSNIEYYSTATRWGSRAWHRRAVRPAGPGPRALRAGMAVRADQRHDRDRREPVPPVRHRPGGGRRVRGAQPAARRGRLGGRDVRRRGDPGRGAAAARRPGGFRPR